VVVEDLFCFADVSDVETIGRLYFYKWLSRKRKRQTMMMVVLFNLSSSHQLEVLAKPANVDFSCEALL
jgi:hypothetical protein